jgi:hypothetical protein
MYCTKNGEPTFDGQNGLDYEIQKIRMKTFLQAEGFEILKSDVKGYTGTKKPPNIATKKKLKRSNKIEMDFIMEVLCNSTKDKVVKCSSSKEIWDKLHNICFYPIKYSKDIGIEQEEKC